MLSFIRRIIYSRVGVIITLGVLVVIALAFAAGDITGTRGNRQSSILGGAVAEVGDTKIGEAELRQRTQTAFAAYRQQQPTLDMASFVSGGGFAAVLDRTINGLALQEFAERTGMAMSKRAVDGEIAGIQAFQGLDGKFSQANYETVLRQQKLTDAQIRDDIARDSLSRQLLAPTIGAAQVPSQLALPYASLLLERRQGVVGIIPVTVVDASAPPSDTELATYYTRQRARYLVPERRAARYAVVRLADVAAANAATDAEVAAAYQSQRARFAPTEKRTLTQVILSDQKMAAALADKVRSGTAIVAAAKALGLEPTSFDGVEKSALAGKTSAAVADAAFAATSGAVVGPVRGALGWAVLKLDKVEAVAGRSLEQARAELTAEVGKAKAAAAMGKLHDSLDDAIGGNATFDEVVGDAKLKAETTAPLLATGVDPDATAPAAPNPMLTQIATAAFAAEPGDAPQLVQIDADGSFAVVATGRTVPAAPRPLAQIKAQVLRDHAIDTSLRLARTAAIAVVDKVNKGTSVATALAQTGFKLPEAKPLNATRAELARQRGQLPPPVALMFSMAPKRAKMLEAPNRGGWFIVYLDAIQPGNAIGNRQLIDSTRQGLGSVIGREYAEQFTSAVREQVGVKRNAGAIAKVQGELSGAAGAGAGDQ